MPPPPPPSKSYLWKFDDLDDSDAEDGSDDTPSLTPTIVSSASFSQTRVDSPQSSSSSRDDEEERSEGDEGSEEPSSASGKRRRRRRKKRSKRKSIPRRTVGFDSVYVRFMDRCLGEDVVPSSGSWPLGIKDDVLDFEEVSVDDYEKSKQERLRQRLESLESIENALKEKLMGDEVLETRLWDYHSSDRKNPLFQSLSEKLRMILLLAFSSPSLSDHAAGPERLGSAPPSLERQTLRKTRARSGSLSGETYAHKNSSMTRLRSHSISEQFNDSFTQLDVHRIRNELESIRNSRTKEGSAGCACRKLNVYLLPPGGGGRKAHHKRMNIQDVKKELRKRHLLPSEPKTREELERLLHDAVEEEGCCINDDCFCVRNGINCQMDACDCWLPSHQTKDSEKKQAYTLTSQQIEATCGNRYGMYVVDLEKIQSFRKQVLASMQFCQEISQ